ncbi:hypothetical protein [Flavihumibacter sp. CACIAM 22H1]|uniref:hypothetical protein n=1 Tax=Flavihumibacter sp. CACIAM 22H1 TaxID=1812911 RepID=UPI000A8F90D3|nr:hypothetical protein [Flavihumibacter sp. CACIAM 22H1]
MYKKFFFTGMGALLICSLVSCNNAGSDTAAESAATPADTTSQTVVVDSTPAYGIHTNRAEAVQLVRETLKALYKEDIDKNLLDSLSRSFILFEYDLNEDGKKEILVAQNGPYFCGTGGCTLLLLSPEGKLLTRFSVTDLPIIVLRNRTNGWNDLLLSSAGKLHHMKFDGKKYPSNPSIAPVFKQLPGDELPRLLDEANEPYPRFNF